MHISMERVHAISCAKLLHFVFYAANPSVALNQAPSHCQRCTEIHLTHKHKRLSHTHTHTRSSTPFCKCATAVTLFVDGQIVAQHVQHTGPCGTVDSLTD